MRREVTGLMMVGLLGLVGCGGSDGSAVEVGEPAEEQEQAVVPEVVSPLELMRQQEKDDASEPVEEEVDTASEAAPTASKAPTANAVHPIAGRSAFPEHDEVIERLIPAERLSSEDQFAEPIDEADIPDVVPWQQAKQYVGYEITVEGKIIDTGQSRDGKVNFLNFHQDWRGKFYMVVFDDLAKTLPQSVDATFRGKTVRVTGEVEEHRGRPQLRILSMDQVEFIDG